MRPLALPPEPRRHQALRGPRAPEGTAEGLVLRGHRGAQNTDPQNSGGPCCVAAVEFWRRGYVAADRQAGEVRQRTESGRCRRVCGQGPKKATQVAAEEKARAGREAEYRHGVDVCELCDYVAHGAVG